MNFFGIMLFIVNFYFFFIFQNLFIITYFFLFFLGHMIIEYLTIHRITQTNPIQILVGLDSRHTSIYCTQTLQQI